MAPKTSASDGFDNPLYDKLLIQLQKESQDVFGEIFRRDWTDKEISIASRRTSKPIDTSTIPDRPIPEVDEIAWQVTLQKSVMYGPASNRRRRTEDAGIVDINFSLLLPNLSVGYDDSDEEYKSPYFVVDENWNYLELRIICRPILKSVASTIRFLNELRDRDRPQDIRPERFGVLTTNKDHQEIFFNERYLYLTMDLDDLIKVPN